MTRLEIGDIVFAQTNYGLQDKCKVIRVTKTQAEIETSNGSVKIEREFIYSTSKIGAFTYTGVRYVAYSEEINNEWERFLKINKCKKLSEIKIDKLNNEALDSYIGFLVEFKSKHNAI